MVSVASLLNPDPPRAPTIAAYPASTSQAWQSASIADESNTPLGLENTAKMTKDPRVLSKSTSKGAVNFPPFENVDEASLREIRRFQVHSFGSIIRCCRRIPYNSGKKDFSQKTGRESFEVFQYEFRVPGEEACHTVMWDYHIGLVRMTPFFKCCKYSKTTPGKMLGLNPGLRDITFSITGGSIKAQGYWMPYYCAREVCATFCHHIAGALIPIFGPDFPSSCIPRDDPRFGRMVIDPATTEAAARQAEQFRQMSSPYSAVLSPRQTGSISPRSHTQTIRTAGHHGYDDDDTQRPRYRGAQSTAGYPAGLATDVDSYPALRVHHQYSYRSATSGFSAAPDPAVAVPRSVNVQSPSWTAVNHRPASYYHPQHIQSYAGEGAPSNAVSPHHSPDPWLSAVPVRRGYRQHPYSRNQLPPAPLPANEHRRNVSGSGSTYSIGGSPSMSNSGTIVGDPEPDIGILTPTVATTEDGRAAAEKDAAMMLINLRAPDLSHSTSTPMIDTDRENSHTCYSPNEYNAAQGDDDSGPYSTPKPSTSPPTFRAALPFSRVTPRVKKRRASLT